MPDQKPILTVSGEIFRAIPAIMAEIPAIAKGKTNTQQGFRYRGIDDVYNAANPLFAKYRVFNVPEVLDYRREERTNQKGTVLAFVILKVKYTFFADDGSSVEVVACGEGMDSGDKATSKAMAMAHKYAILQLFCVPTEDMIDGDAESPELVVPVYITTSQASMIYNQCNELGGNTLARMLKWLGVKEVAQIEVEHFDTVIAKLKQLREEK